MAQQTKFDLDPTFWPSATALRPHLRPDITTLERTPQGLEITCRYCLPSGGVNGPLWTIVLTSVGNATITARYYMGDPFFMAPPEVVPNAGPGAGVPPALPAEPTKPSDAVLRRCPMKFQHQRLAWGTAAQCQFRTGAPTTSPYAATPPAPYPGYPVPAMPAAGSDARPVPYPVVTAAPAVGTRQAQTDHSRCRCTQPGRR